MFARTSKTENSKNPITRVRLRHQVQITFFLLIVIFGFMMAFVPLDKIGLKVGDKQWLDVLVKLASSAVLSNLLRIPLFGTDALVSGSSKESEFFRGLYPSVVISKNYGVERGKATDLWFSIFNKWSDPKHPQHFNWETMFGRTYNCRLIFYLTRLLMYTLILSIGFIGLMFLAGVLTLDSISDHLMPVLFLFLTGTAYLLLITTNRLPSKSRDATGCWYKYREASEVIHSILERGVFKKYDTYESASRILCLPCDI